MPSLKEVKGRIASVNQVVPRSRGRGTYDLRPGAPRQACSPRRIFVELFTLRWIQRQHHQIDAACR